MKYTLILLFSLFFTVQLPAIETEEAAHSKFDANFRALFQVQPEMPTYSEREFIDFISRKIWDSRNVQKLDEKEKYKAYEQLMTEFYSGSHMLFEENSKESILKELKQKFGNQIIERFSSHYGAVGSETQHSFRGRQLPEILFHEGFFEIKDGKIIPAKYADSGIPEQNKFKAFWIQTEKTAERGDFSSWFWHRVDFVQYYFLKNIIKSDRPQIANYVGPLGRGVPDTNPIIIFKTN